MGSIREGCLVEVQRHHILKIADDCRDRIVDGFVRELRVITNIYWSWTVIFPRWHNFLIAILLARKGVHRETLNTRPSCSSGSGRILRAGREHKVWYFLVKGIANC
jgi:hypothetical protein